MNYNKVEICGVDTSKLPVIKEKEKVELLRRAREGDEAARERMIACNLRLVLSVVQKFSNRGENLDDLFQVGCIGLIKAIDNFDPTLMVKFSTYGVPMIIGEIRRYLRDNNSIRVSRSMRDTAYKALQVRERLLGERLEDPTVTQIADEMGLLRQEVVAALEAIIEPISLYEPVYSDGGDTIFVMDQVGDPSGDSDWLDEIAFREAVDNLAGREKKILSLRFVTGRTQMEV
ncbi:MAG: sigma-70 family RNA polymerase sigma factor, partial [Oscillospiraceae bacterium]